MLNIFLGVSVYVFEPVEIIGSSTSDKVSGGKMNLNDIIKGHFFKNVPYLKSYTGKPDKKLGKIRNSHKDMKM